MVQVQQEAMYQACGLHCLGLIPVMTRPSCKCRGNAEPAGGGVLGLLLALSGAYFCHSCHD